MIKENVQRLLQELPSGVQLAAAVKSRSIAEIKQALSAGIKILGENYVQEAEAAFNIIGARARWHFIGHLQKNKAKKAVKIFDMIETLDSVELAEELNSRCAQASRTMPVLIEVNSGREKQKYGVMPDAAEEFIRRIAPLKKIKIMGLMTMGPAAGNAELTRPYFVETRGIFERIKSLNIPDVEMKYLSMGMSNSYKTAVEEGANIVRIGSKIFGER